MERLLAAGDSVMAVESRPGCIQSSAVRSIEADLTGALDALAKAVAEFQPTHVVHLAALASVTAHQALDYYRVNVLGTERLLELLVSRCTQLRKVVIASSANVYGNSSVLPITEGECPAPVNHYAASKVAMESVARVYFDKLPILIARPFNYTGVGQSTGYLVPKLVEHFAARRASISLGNVAVARDISDVRYVVEIYSRLLDVDAIGVLTNICSGRSTSIEQMLHDLSRMSGHSLDVMVDPSLVRSAEITELRGSNQLLMQLVGMHEPPPIAQTLDWMLRNWVAS